jgi:hypothetical protein
MLCNVCHGVGATFSRTMLSRYFHTGSCPRERLLKLGGGGSVLVVMSVKVQKFLQFLR